MSPRSVAPLFVLFALLHAAGIVSRYEAVAAMLPAGSANAIVVAQMALLFVGGFFEALVNYGEQNTNLPLWMRIRSKPIKLAFALAMTYIAVVVVQTWDISIGPFDPTPPESWSAAKRAQWFAMMTGASLFPSYLLAASVVIPAFRLIARPFTLLPFALGVLLVVGLGVGAGFGAQWLLASQQVASTLGSGQALLETNPALLVGLILAPVLLPIVFGAMLKRKPKADDEQD